MAPRTLDRVSGPTEKTEATTVAAEPSPAAEEPAAEPVVAKNAPTFPTESAGLEPGMYGIVTGAGGRSVYIAAVVTNAAFLKSGSKVIEEPSESMDSTGVRIEVDEALLPKELQLTGKELDLYDNDVAVACKAKLKKPWVLAYSQGATDRETIEASQAYVVFDITKPCKTALWGRLSELGAPTIAKPHSANPHVVQLVRDIVTKEDRFHEISAQSGDPFGTSTSLPATVTSVDWNGTELTFALVDDGAHGCTSEAPLSKFFTRKGEALTEIAGGMSYTNPTLIDLDLDGAPEVLEAGSVYAVNGQTLSNYYKPFYGCGC